MYTLFSEFPFHQIKNRGIGRHIYQVIFHQIFKVAIPQNWRGILLWGDEVRLGHKILKSRNGIHQSLVVYSLNLMNGNFSETSITLIYDRLEPAPTNFCVPIFFDISQVKMNFKNDSKALKVI